MTNTTSDRTSSVEQSGLAASRRVGRPERREQLVELAGEIALAEGVGAVTMERVAAAAEVNKTIVYRVFANRGEVVAALFEREFGALAERIVGAGADATDIETWLRSAVKVWFDAIAENDGLLSVLLDGGTDDDELHERRSLWEKQSTRDWGEGIALLTGADVEDAMDASAIVLAGLRGAVARWREDGRDRHVVENRLVAIAIAAIGGLA